MGFAFLVLRIFAVSGYDWHTAFGVSTTLGLDDGLALVFGSLMAGHLLTGVLLMCVLPLLIAAYLWGPPDHRPLVTLLVTLGLVVLAALTGSFHSWWLPVATLALFAALILVRRLPPRSSLRRASTAVLARVSWVPVLPCCSSRPSSRPRGFPTSGSAPRMAPSPVMSSASTPVT